MKSNQPLMRAMFALFLLISSSQVMAKSARDNRSMVYWVLYDDAQMFLKSPEKVRDLFVHTNWDGSINKKSYFHIPAKQYYHVPLAADFEASRVLPVKKLRALYQKQQKDMLCYNQKVCPELGGDWEYDKGELSYTEHLLLALEDLKGKKNPTLYFFFDSHGTKGKLCRQTGTGSWIDHKNLVDNIFDQIDLVKVPNLKIMFFMDTCHSESLFDALIPRIKKEDKFNYNVEAIVSSDKEKSSYGTFFIDTLRMIWGLKVKKTGESDTPMCFNNSDWDSFCQLDDVNSHHYFSTKSGKVSEGKIEIQKIHQALQAPSARARRAALYWLNQNEKVIIDKALVDKLFFLLADSESQYQIKAAKILMRSGQDFSDRIEKELQNATDLDLRRGLTYLLLEAPVLRPSILKELIKDLKAYNPYYLNTLVRAIGSFGKKAIPSLIYELKNSGDDLYREKVLQVLKFLAGNSAMERYIPDLLKMFLQSSDVIKYDFAYLLIKTQSDHIFSLFQLLKDQRVSMDQKEKILFLFQSTGERISPYTPKLVYLIHAEENIKLKGELLLTMTHSSKTSLVNSLLRPFLKASNENLQQVIEVLKARGPEGHALIPDLIALFKTIKKNTDLRMDILYVLMGMEKKSTAAGPFLFALFQNPAMSEFHEQALECLSKMGPGALFSAPYFVDHYMNENQKYYDIVFSFGPKVLDYLDPYLGKGTRDQIDFVLDIYYDFGQDLPEVYKRINFEKLLQNLDHKEEDDLNTEITYALEYAPASVLKIMDRLLLAHKNKILLKALLRGYANREDKAKDSVPVLKRFGKTKLGKELKSQVDRAIRKIENGHEYF